MLSKIITFLIGSTLLLTACAGAASPESVVMEKVVEVAEAPAAEAGRSFDMDANQSEAASVERLVIKNAQLRIVVSDPAVSMDRISRLAEEFGGYVVSANLYQTQISSGLEVPQANITIRIPAERLDEALQRVKQETDQPVLSENISSQDITGDYTDLESRLRNLEATEAQLQEIMDAATKTPDVLSVYAELTRVREQIEVIKGQMQYYEQSVALSAVSIELIADEAVQPLKVGNWQPAGVAKDAIQLLINTLQIFGNLIIWLGLYLIPVALICLGPLALIGYGVLRARKRRKARLTPPSSS
jgi:hypothetical protein